MLARRASLVSVPTISIFIAFAGPQQAILRRCSEIRTTMRGGKDSRLGCTVRPTHLALLLGWRLRYGSPLRDLDEFTEELGLCDGMPVTLYYEDESEEFEVSAVLVEAATHPRWHARADWKTRRQIRG